MKFPVLKIDKYRKRQLSALILFILLIVIIVSFIKCAAGFSNKKNDPRNNAETAKPETSVTQNEEPKTEDMTHNEVHSDGEFVPVGNIVFENVLLEPDDVSLINEKYIDDVVIVGDSISKGCSVYGRIKEDNVLAVGSIGVRNVLETDFPYQGYELKITDILERKKPKYIFISLGMNDINLRTEKQYTDDFKNFINEISNVTPESVIIATAITPVSRQTTFTQNEKIDLYNEALRKMVFDLHSDKVYYVNAAKYLKGSDNYLIPEYSSGDGIHLATSAYDQLLTYMLTMLEWI